MPRRRALRSSLARSTSRPGVPDRSTCAEATPARREAFDIDELTTSPWIGLHYRYEFLLHYKHELLGPHLRR
jgi:hypothetical protein